MVPRLKISSNVIKRLEKHNTTTHGHLYGIMYDNTLLIITLSIHESPDNESPLNCTTLQLSLPVEVDLCGVFVIGQCEEEIPRAFQDIDVTDNPLLLKCALGGTNLQPFFYIHETLESAGTLEVIEEHDIWRQFTYIRIQSNFPIVAQRDNVINVLQESRKNVASGRVGFHFPGSNVYLLGTEHIPKDVSIGELLHTSETYEGTGNNRSNSKGTPKVVNAVPVNMLLKATKDRLLEGDIKYAPVLQHVKRAFECLKLNLKIDALALVSCNENASQLFAILVETVCRHLKLIERSLLEYLQKENSSIKLPEPMHFKPFNCGHLLTLIYPTGYSNEEMLAYRRNLHKILALDMTRPCFREGNAVIFQSDIGKNSIILNPHEALAPSGGGKVSTVDGLYAYHHYMQDEFDDNGWGCAYRSLQTIISWYRLQGYTDVPIPTHKRIQECLVDIGDKRHDFIGSKQWIGSTEVGFVLESLLGITVKVLCASSGEEMSTLATNLAYHFQNHGTPVMIGGGVLAHTIIGVDCDESSGEVKFLILDPHYTGSENLNTIVSKGWCGWKSKDFWKKDAFYNMCLPQRPVCI